MPPEWYAYRAAAFRNQEVTGAVRVAPVGFVRDEHRDVIAEIANELLRVEGTSIGIAIGVTTRGVEVSVRADSRLLEQDQQRIVRVIDYLLETAFPGVSGFKHDRRPPHRVEGGACVPLTPEQRTEWRLDRRLPGRRQRADPGALPGARAAAGVGAARPRVPPARRDGGAAPAVGARKEIPVDEKPVRAAAYRGAAEEEDERRLRPRQPEEPPGSVSSGRR